MTTAIVPIQDIKAMAVSVAESGLFGIKTPQQAMALMLVAQSEGLHPATAARDYHIINGKPALRADTMLARFQAAGGKVEWHSYTDEAVSCTLTHPQGSSVKIEWTIAQAQKAGLTGNPTWKKFPRAMLRARCISEGIRTVFPGVVSGFYTPEEVQDFLPPEKDVTPEPVSEKPAPKKREPKPVIEGTARTITGDPSEGDISMVGTIQADIDKVLAAFATIGMDQDAIDKEYGKPMAEWTPDDIVEAREVFKVLRAQQQQQAEI